MTPEQRHELWSRNLKERWKFSGDEKSSSATLDQLRDFGRALAQLPLSLSPKLSWTLALTGPLGSGKTTLVQSLGDALGIAQGEVVSPTFTYSVTHFARRPLHHFDLYRLESGAAFAAAGFADILDAPGVSCLEWAERLAAPPPLCQRPHLQIALEYSSSGLDRRAIWVAPAHDWPRGRVQQHSIG